jgi:hypothetical protein
LDVDQPARRFACIDVHLNEALLNTLLRPAKRGGE